MNIQPISTSLPPQSPPEANLAPREIMASVAQKQTESQTAQTVSDEQLKAAVKSVEDYIRPFNSNIEFSVNKDTDQIVTKVIDTATKEIIRQIPSEEMLAIAKALDSLKGLLVKQTA